MHVTPPFGCEAFRKMGVSGARKSYFWLHDYYRARSPRTPCGHAIIARHNASPLARWLLWGAALMGIFVYI